MMEWLNAHLFKPENPLMDELHLINQQEVRHYFNHYNSTPVLWADNTPGNHARYEPDRHIKYNALVNLRGDAQWAEGQWSLPNHGSTIPMKPEDWKKEHPKRSALAQKAYTDFLRGLEVVGAQEHVETAQFKIPKPEKIKILKQWMPASEANRKDVTLHKLAQWERFLQLRRDAPIRRKWYTNLKQRALGDVNKQPTDASGKEGSGNERYPSIRPSTFNLLTRLPEADFDIIKWMLLIISVGTLSLAFISQIFQIIMLCPDSYMCPATAVWPSRPVPAPPATFRTNTLGFLQTHYYDYYLNSKLKCNSGEPFCDNGGYMVQWPYMQSGAQGVIAFAPQLRISGACTRTVGGAQGWMWNYYQGNVMNEFWDCGGKEKVSFVQDGTPFYLQTDWYELAHEVTLDCLAKTLTKGANLAKDVAVWESVDWATNLLVRAEMENCFISEMEDQGGSRLQCKCTVTNAKFMLSSVTEETLPTHELYGCFFDTLDATKRAAQSYHACRAVPYKSVVNSEAIQQEAYQVFRDRMQKNGAGSLAGRKTGALVFFLVKEGGPFTAFVLISILWLGCLIIYPVIFAGFLVANTLFISDEFARMRMRNTTFVALKSLIMKLTVSCWDLSMRASSSFSVGRKLRNFGSVISGGSMQINNSMVKDGRDQITSIFNITVNLLLVAFAEVGINQGAEGGILWASIIVSILNLTMIIVMRQQTLKLHTGFFKDVNENRINKFEIALGVVKLMEDFLEEDVQFNFVQHFYDDKKRLCPQELDDYESSASFRNECQASLLNMNQGTEQVLDDLAAAELLFCSNQISTVNSAPITGLHQYYPFIEPGLAKIFGHDGRYEYGDRGKASQLVDTMQLEKVPTDIEVESKMSTPGPVVNSMFGQYPQQFAPMTSFAGASNAPYYPNAQFYY